MVPLAAARIEDLGPGDLVWVECAACGHDVLIPPNAVLQGLRLAPPQHSVPDLKSRLRCRECDAKGKAVVSIRWEKMPDDRLTHGSNGTVRSVNGPGHFLLWEIER
jgi:hypothetical protein